MTTDLDRDRPDAERKPTTPAATTRASSIRPLPVWPMSFMARVRQARVA